MHSVRGHALRACLIAAAWRARHPASLHAWCVQVGGGAGQRAVLCSVPPVALACHQGRHGHGRCALGITRNARVPAGLLLRLAIR